MKGFSICILLLHAMVVLDWMAFQQCDAFGPTIMVQKSSPSSSMTKNTATIMTSSSTSISPQCLVSVHARTIPNNNNDQSVSLKGTTDHQRTRRSIFNTVGAALLTTIAMTSLPIPARAIPMVSVEEFGIILRDSPLSVQVVEFSGPKSENVLVRLVDGTTFGIKDVMESSTDPRSPLKVAAACREVNVKTKFVDLEAVLATAPKKKKMYTNQRVQEAQEKEKARLERMRKDEEDRLAQLARMEQLEEQGAVGKN